MSIAVLSWQTAGISCVNVSVSPFEAGRLTEYVIETRKAVCVQQSLIGEEDVWHDQKEEGRMLAPPAP